MGFKPYSIVREYFLKRNIKIRHYESLGDNDRAFVDYTIKNSLRPNPRLRVGRKKLKPKSFDLWETSWSDMILTWKHLEENNIKDVLKLHYGLREQDFLNLNIFNAFAVYKWVSERVKEINDIMKAELGDEPDNDQKAAGADEFKRYDYLPTLKKLCNDDRTKYDWMLKQPFSWIFREISLINTETEYQRNLNEIASRKTKRSV